MQDVFFLLFVVPALLAQPAQWNAFGVIIPSASNLSSVPPGWNACPMKCGAYFIGAKFIP